MEAVDSAAQAVQDAEAVVGMLPDSEALENLLDGGLGDALGAGTLLLDCSTSEPARSVATAHRLGAAGTTMLDVPVFGSKAVAEAGS